MRVLLLGTYPIDKPIHGGQRRGAKIMAAYREVGAECLHLAVYPRDRYLNGLVDERSFRYSDRRIGWCELVPYCEDVFSGVLAAEDDECYAWLRRHVRQFHPTHVHFEQPFMFPVIERLTRDGLSDYALIYSSQNIEAPLKRLMLRQIGVEPDYAAKVASFVERVEHELVRAALVVVCASEDEQVYYERLGARRILVCRNGADPSNRAITEAVDSPEAGPFLLTVGSGHLPNSTGFAELMLSPALFFLPPRCALVIAGDMSYLLETDPRFSAFREANLQRVQLLGAVSDAELDALKALTHGFLLPLRSGGGTNLKTAEAILSGKWVVGTSTAMRGFTEFASEPGVVIEDDPRRFRTAVRDVLNAPPLALDARAKEKRQSVTWHESLAPLKLWAMQHATEAAFGGFA